VSDILCVRPLQLITTIPIVFCSLLAGAGAGSAQFNIGSMPPLALLGSVFKGDMRRHVSSH